MRYFIACLICVGSTPAVADPPNVVETHGVEIELPSGWSVKNEGNNTTIAPPKKYKGRGIEIAEIKGLPPSKELVAQFLDAGKLKHGAIQEEDRNGMHVALASATAMIAGKALDLDVVAIPNSSGGTTLAMSFITSSSDPALKEVNDKLLRSVRIAGPKIKLVVEKPSAPTLKGVPPKVSASIGKMAAHLDGALRLPRVMPIEVKDCGVVNAFYSSSRHAITICHEFWDDTLALFKRGGASDAQALELTYGTVVFAFFHEFGHALVGEFELPITGKGEDAADEIATIILGFTDDGRKAALEGAEWFRTMAKEPDHSNVFWDEHSFDEQRVISITCLLYGSAPDTYAPLMKKMAIPEARLAKCVRDYKDRLHAWATMLESHARVTKKK
jgi:hypothetical protein